MTTCGDGRMVSRVRALGGNEKLLCVVRESVGPEILGHGDIMRDAPLVRASPFFSYGRCVYQGRISHFIVKGDMLTRRGLTLTRIILHHHKNFRETIKKGKEMARTGQDWAPPLFCSRWEHVL
jgi:hypothetical protein